VNYPTLLGLTASLRVGLPGSATRFFTDARLTPTIRAGSAVSAGRSKIEDFRDHERLRLSDDPIGFRVIAVRTTVGPPPLVVRGRPLTESVTSI